jgi:hypothetical protein
MFTARVFIDQPQLQFMKLSYDGYKLFKCLIVNLGMLAFFTWGMFGPSYSAGEKPRVSSKYLVLQRMFTHGMLFE